MGGDVVSGRRFVKLRDGFDQRMRETLRRCRACGSGCSVIYSRQNGVLFTHVSRTGGTTISDCLFAKAGIECPTLPRVNVSRHHHYSAYYSAFRRELIEQIFPEDVVQLGYRFEDRDEVGAMPGFRQVP